MFLSRLAKEKFDALWDAIDASPVIPPCQVTDPDLWFRDENFTNYTAARKFCERCPVRELCLDYALENKEEFGMWGGKSPKERLKLWDRGLYRPQAPKSW